MSSKKSKGFIIGIAVAVLLPLSFFLYYNKSVSNALNIPRFYRPDRVDSHIVKGEMQYDTVFHTLKDLNLTNQLGQQVSLNKDLKGKILVINFFFSKCPTVCPALTQNIKGVVKAFDKKSTDLVQFVSISVDPNDSVPVLRQYANKYTTSHDRWWFLTGNKDAIFDYAKNELGLKLDAETPDEFIHSQQVVLVDTFRNIRGYYDGMDARALAKIADGVILLDLEKRKNKK
ncbi:SCO family protein [Taibaiella sp. KBW10]|uniref:SCO family protein n=1 Tax=Taibaiella sp. KBW10 TaxID=2153357 RepID=UPI000F592F22|nr:SCO family protein [Taibaiella sp. KBW10]RQO30048.1 SCO family protein [Taibaiella sp. KBW10]